MPIMTARVLFLWGALMMFVSVASAGGAYQRTKDGKTIIWNNHPQPGETASWWGDRDDKGYANGFGTLTWYRAQQKADGDSTKSSVYARYFGNMVRGKFHGPVNVHSSGKTAHAVFIDGERTSGWTAGPAPSRKIATRDLPRTGEKRADIAKARKSQSGALLAPPERDIPAEGPIRTAAGANRATAKPPVGTAKSQPSPGADRVEEASTTQSVGKPITQPSPAGTPGQEAPPDRPSVVVKRPPNKAVPPPPSYSLKRLAGPPPSLGASAMTDASPAAQPAARLTKEEVVSVADATARSRGYDPSEYQRSEPQYDPADDTWSLLYEQKAEGMVDVGKHFSVAVEDKTKETSIVPGR